MEQPRMRLLRLRRRDGVACCVTVELSVTRSMRWSDRACFNPVSSKIAGQLGAQSERSWTTGTPGAEEGRVPR